MNDVATIFVPKPALVSRPITGFGAWSAGREVTFVAPPEPGAPVAFRVEDPQLGIVAGTLESFGASKAPAPAALRGFVDRVTPHVVSGWAFNPDCPDSPVDLEIVVAGAVVARLAADRFRPDLASRGYGSGCHAFSAMLPVTLGAAEQAALEVRRCGDGARLERPG